MTIEDSQAPRGKNQQAGAGKENAHQPNRQFAFFTVKSGGDQVNQIGSGQDSEQHEDRGRQGQQRGDGAGGSPGLFVVIPREQSGVDRNERSGENSFAKHILQKIGNSECGAEGVCCVRVAEVVREDAVADQACDAAEENTGCDQERVALGCGFGRVALWDLRHDERVAGAIRYWR